MLHKNAFCELQVEIAGLQAGFSQGVTNTRKKGLRAKLGRGDVDGNPLERQTRVLPFACLPARLVEHPTSDGKNESTILGNGKKAGRSNGSMIRMLPA